MVNSRLEFQGNKRKCPKCGGNLFLVKDYNGMYEQCLQCSLIRYFDPIYDGQLADAEKTSETEEISAS